MAAVKWFQEEFVNLILITRILPHFKMELAPLQTPLSKLEFQITLCTNFTLSVDWERTLLKVGKLRRPMRSNGQCASYITVYRQDHRNWYMVHFDSVH